MKKKTKTAPQIPALDHVFLPTANFEKAWAFWTAAAGGEIGAMWEGDGHHAGMVKLGGVNVVVSQEAQSAAEPELGYPIHYGRPVLFFKTPNIDKLYRDLANGGASILRGPLTTHWGKRALSIRAGEAVIAFVEDKSAARKKPKSRER